MCMQYIYIIYKYRCFLCARVCKALRSLTGFVPVLMHNAAVNFMHFAEQREEVCLLSVLFIANIFCGGGGGGGSFLPRP